MTLFWVFILWVGLFDCDWLLCLWLFALFAFVVGWFYYSSFCGFSVYVLVLRLFIWLFGYCVFRVLLVDFDADFVYLLMGCLFVLVVC